MAGVGRRPGSDSSSAEVLAAARTLFAQHGYRATTMRAIADKAGVAPGMIHHFFGTKEQVFVAATRIPLDPGQLILALTTGPRDQFPDRLVRTFVQLWFSDTTGPPLRSMLRSAIADEQAAVLRGFAESVMLPALTTALDVPKSDIATALSSLLGLVVSRILIGIDELTALSDEEVISLYTPIVRTALRL